MQITNSDKAQVLAEALPYIQDYAGKVVVVKYGGNAMVDGALKAAVMSDIVLLSLAGIKIVLVHGGGPEITDTLKAIGKDSRFLGRWRSWCSRARPTRTSSTCSSSRGAGRSVSAALTAG